MKNKDWVATAKGRANWLCRIGIAIIATTNSSRAAREETSTEWAGLRSTIQNPPAPTGQWKRATHRIPRVKTPPKIDGILDDACWKDACHAEGFFRFQGTDPVHEQTEAWICADSDHLYFGFHCLDSHPEMIRANETQREGDLSRDDQVIVVIDSQGTRRNSSQFNVSARGTQQTQLEGGTADNLTWAGDWTAACHRTKDGWTAEIAIPFHILRYPRGSNHFGIILGRQLARETSVEVWPYIPPQGDNNIMAYLDDFEGFEAPFYPPKLVGLPYILATGGETNALRAGLDVKYPLSTTLTGVGTLFPDFQTVEQAVQDLSFSYTEKFVPDRRPFFVEGNSYQQDSFLFYSQRIPAVDEGIKIVGKQGLSTISALTTNTNQANGQTAFYTNFAQDLGLYSQVGGALLGNNSGGQPANRVARGFGQYGFSSHGRQTSLYTNYTESWTAGQSNDHNDYVQLSSYAGHGKLGVQASYQETGPSFVNELGLVPETDARGEGLNLNWYNSQDRGRVESESINLNTNTFRHMTGGFFHDDLGLYTNWQMRSGWSYELDADSSKYYPFVDDTITTALNWNQKTLFQRGGVSYQFGRREDQSYGFASVSQGLLLCKALTLQLNFGLERLGGQENTQTIATGTYRINSQETIGGRLVQQNGDIDVYLSYGRRVRHGTDVFVLLGDPNSPRTRGIVIVKLVRPF